jgi:hypothetical protein
VLQVGDELERNPTVLHGMVMGRGRAHGLITTTLPATNKKSLCGVPVLYRSRPSKSNHELCHHTDDVTQHTCGKENSTDKYENEHPKDMPLDHM